jgi:hypothetical protein
MSSINLRFGLTALLGLIACGALAQGGRSAGATNALSASAAATIRQWGISLRDTEIDPVARPTFLFGNPVHLTNYIRIKTRIDVQDVEVMRRSPIEVSKRQRRAANEPDTDRIPILAKTRH